MKKVEMDIFSNFDERLANESPQVIPNSQSPSLNTRLESKITFVSPIKVFEVEFKRFSYQPLQVQCTASIDIVTATIKFEIQQVKTRSVFKQIALDCSEIEQVKKSQNHPQRLLLLKKNHIDYFYIDFLNARNREDFIYCLYGAKKYQAISHNKESDCLSLFVGTWNLGSTKPTENLSQWLKCQGSGTPLLHNVASYVPHDIYIIAIQEDSLDQQWDSSIRSYLQLSFNQDFTLISTKSNSFPKTLRLSLFCRSNLEKHFKNVNIDTINTGFANKCGNKGAVSISFNYQDASICLINCHLTSGVEHAKKREEEFQTILQRLHLDKDKQGHSDLLQRYDFIFCMGDFNLRTDKHVTEAVKLLQNHQSHILLQSDELKKYHMVKNQNPFKQFKEAEIFHGPTYRYLKGTRNNLDPFKKKIGQSDKINVPSWCDRVLYKSRNDSTIYPISYGIQLDNKVSDHKPVFSSFLLALPTRDYLENHSPMSSANIKIDEILIKINHDWRSRKNFQIYVEGSLLKESYQYKDPTVIVDSPESKVYLVGQSKLKELLKILDLNNRMALLFIYPFNIMLLKMGLSKRDIETNYLSITILTCDYKTEYIANTVIPLKRFSMSQSHSFEVQLYEHGFIVGSMTIQGAINYKIGNNSQSYLPVPRLIDLFDNSYSNEDNNSRSLFDLINEMASNNYKSKKFIPIINNIEEGSVFRPIHYDNELLSQTFHHTSPILDTFQSSIMQLNGMNISTSVKPAKTQNAYSYNMEINDFYEYSSNNKEISSNIESKSRVCNNPKEVESVDVMAKSLNCYENTMATNKGYSSIKIREGICNKKRDMDTRIDLSKLQTDLNIIEPPLPPRSIWKNVIHAARNERSNPISIASTFGPSHNTKFIRETSFSLIKTSVFKNQDFEYEDPSNYDGFCKQNIYSRNDTSDINFEEPIETDKSSQHSTIPISTNCPSSSQYVQSISTVLSTNETNICKAYTSTQKINDVNSTSDVRKLSNEIEYVVLQKPLDLREWLNSLCIPLTFIEKILCSSFNNAEAIINANDDDLKSLGILDIKCRRIILNGVMSLLN